MDAALHIHAPAHGRGRNELGSVLWQFRREFLAVAVCSLVANLLMLAPTLYMLQIYDRVLISRSELTLLAVSLLTLALFGVMALAEWLRARVLVAISVRLDRRLSARVFEGSFAAALGSARSAVPRALADLVHLRQFLTGSGVLAFFDAPWVPIYIAVLWILHPALGMLALAFAAIQALLAWQGHHRTVAPAEAAAASGHAEASFLRGKFHGSEALESMGMLGSLWKRWGVHHQAHLANGARLQGLTHRVTAFSKFIRYSQQSFALGLGGLLAIDGQLSMGGMIAASVLMSRALAPLDMLVASWRGLITARAAYARLRCLLAEEPASDAACGMIFRGAVTLRDVRAHAPERAEPILKSIDLQLAPGSVTVVVGPSGSGKSTLARTIVGAWPQVSGMVLLDQTLLAQWRREDLGAQVGYLPQDIELFDGTIAENIARFTKVDTHKVIAAARSAGLHDAILRLPRGYDTPVGDAGLPLSGGQKQRIALARAVYGNPALVVLDEPNANLDEAGEAALGVLVHELKTAGTTVFLVTHRPGILAAADNLLVLRDGEIERQGRPDQIVADTRRAAQAASPCVADVATAQAATPAGASVHPSAPDQSTAPTT